MEKVRCVHVLDSSPSTALHTLPGRTFESKKYQTFLFCLYRDHCLIKQLSTHVSHRIVLDVNSPLTFQKANSFSVCGSCWLLFLIISNESNLQSIRQPHWTCLWVYTFQELFLKISSEYIWYSHSFAHEKSYRLFNSTNMNIQFYTAYDTRWFIVRIVNSCRFRHTHKLRFKKWSQPFFSRNFRSSPLFLGWPTVCA